MTTEINKAQLYWDDQDPLATGWWLRWYDSRGVEQGAAIDGDEDESTEVLAQRVARECDGWGRVDVYRGGGPRSGWIEIDDGRVTDWRAL